MMMSRPLLPPREVHVSTRMIYHPQMPPALLLTWIQLRGLAWGGTVTPPLRMQELAALTGKCQATLYQHMSQLRRMSALSWRSTGLGTIIVSFADEPPVSVIHAKNSPPIPGSQILESAVPPSLSAPSDLDSKQVPEGEGDRAGERESEGERGLLNLHTGEPANVQTLISDPAATYRALTHLTPNPSQRLHLSSKVTDPTLWHQTVDHWLTHGWNPRNITGMLELYGRGGPAGCRFCRGRQEVKTPLQHSLEALETLIQEQDQKRSTG